MREAAMWRSVRDGSESHSTCHESCISRSVCMCTAGTDSAGCTLETHARDIDVVVHLSIHPPPRARTRGQCSRVVAPSASPLSAELTMRLIEIRELVFLCSTSVDTLHRAFLAASAHHPSPLSRCARSTSVRSSFLLRLPTCTVNHCTTEAQRPPGRLPLAVNRRQMRTEERASSESRYSVGPLIHPRFTPEDSGVGEFAHQKPAWQRKRRR